MPNDTQTVTLTDFLLARIAEDEGVAHAAREHEYLSSARDASPLRWVRDPLGYGTIWVNSGRVLAECAARRQIVEYYGLLLEQGEQAEVFGYHATGLGVAIRHLAAVYADHPDYREEWRD